MPVCLIFRDRRDGFGGSARQACRNTKLIVFVRDKRVSLPLSYTAGRADYPRVAAGCQWVLRQRHPCNGEEEDRETVFCLWREKETTCAQAVRDGGRLSVCRGIATETVCDGISAVPPETIGLFATSLRPRSRQRRCGCRRRQCLRAFYIT